MKSSLSKVDYDRSGRADFFVARCVDFSCGSVPGQERDSDVLQNLHAMNGKDTQGQKELTGLRVSGALCFGFGSGP